MASVRMTAELHAKATLAAAHRKMSLPDYVADAVEAALERDRQAIKEQRYQAAVKKAAEEMKPTPLRKDFERR